MSAACFRVAEVILPTSFEEVALLSWFGRVDPGPLIRSGLRRRDLPEVIQPIWNGQAVSLLFGLDRPSHCFHAAPHIWASFHEPQITRGFAHFLNQGSPGRRLARATVLVKAAMACAGKNSDSVDTFGATSAYCQAEENRTDILIELRRDEKRIGASIEAKFGHRLTRGQLPKALKLVRDKRGWTLANSVLLVVAPGQVKSGKAILRNYRNSEWQMTDWASLILKIEAFTNDQHDCADYRRFRRTVWHRAHEEREMIGVPQSVLAYFQNRDVETAIDHLLAAQKGKRTKLIGVDHWAHLPSYYRATLAAHQTQIEFAIFLEELWRAVWTGVPPTWNECSPSNPARPDLAVNVATVWGEKCFGHRFEVNDRTVELYVGLWTDDGLQLGVLLNDADESALSLDDALPSWSRSEDYDTHWTDGDIVPLDGNIDPAKFKEVADKALFAVNEILRQI